MKLEDALPTITSTEELDGYLNAARLAGDSFTHAQRKAIADRRSYLEKRKA